MTRGTRATLTTGAAALALLMSSASVVVAYGETPPEPIDPDCEPEKALLADPQLADPELVEPPDGVCPPGEEPSAEPKAPDPQAPGAPATPAGPNPVPDPLPGPVTPPLPVQAPVAPSAPRSLGSEPAEQPRRRPVPERLRAERRVASGGAEAPGPRPRARRRERAERTSDGGSPAPSADAHAVFSSQAGMPAFLLPIYHGAGRAYGIPWEVLAAINEIETAYGRNLNVSSAGARGWMQFMPATWRAYGLDASGDGVADPYDPVDAIHSAAHYLSASGYARDPRAALFAYNHATWYVDWVLARARAIAAGGLLVHDPLKRARRLHPRFAARLERIAERALVPWELTLAVLRARGHSGRMPATAAELRRLTGRLAALGAGSDPRRAAHLIAGERRLLARRTVALAHYHRAVGLRGLVRGLERVRTRLARQVLASPRLEIYAAGRDDIRRGVTDVRVLVLLRYLASRYNEVTVTSLTSGHSYLTASGNVSAHSYGRAVDIAALNGEPIFGNQAPDGLTERALWSILLLPAELRPGELISLLELGGPSFALPDHADHIHVGY